MKKLLLLLIITFTITIVYAQKGKINSAYSSVRSGNLSRAKMLLDKGISHRKCIEWAKSYFVKGIVYQSIFEKSTTAYKSSSNNPLLVAYKAYKKCIELDGKEKFKKKMIPYFKNLRIDFTNEGSKYFNNGKYELAYNYFKTALEISNSKVLKNIKTKNTAIYYYTGVASFNVNKNIESIKYYKKALEDSYKIENCYESLADLYIKIGDKETGLEYLKEGHVKFPSNHFILGRLVDYYLSGDDYKKTEEFLNAAIVLEPNNVRYYTAMGSLYEKMKRFDEAIDVYNKILEIDPNNFIALYNTSIFKYNKILDRYKSASKNVVSEKEYTQKVNIINRDLEKLIPSFEKAYKINPKEIATVIVLKEIYTKLRYQSNEYMAMFEYFLKLEKEMQAK